MYFEGHYYQISSYKTFYSNSIRLASGDMYNGQLGHLATISSKAEYDFIDQTLRAHNVWIGATDVHREGQWVFSAGPNFGSLAPTYLWAAGEPSISNVKNCALSTTDGLRSSDCTTYYFYLIEYECQTVNSSACECMFGNQCLLNCCLL